MKVLVVNLFFSPASHGGATLVVEQTAVEMARRGVEVDVVASTRVPGVSTGHIRRYTTEGVTVLAMRMDLTSAYDDPEISDAFGVVLDAVAPDVVHFHAIQSFGVGVVEETQKRGIPSVVTMHDAWWLCERQFMMRSNLTFCGQEAIDTDVCATCIPTPSTAVMRKERSLAVLNACDRVLVPSEHWRRLMAGSGVRSDILFVNANGVARPPEGWRRTPRSGPVRLGFVGGRNPIKGYHQVVDALELIKRSDYELRIADPAEQMGEPRTTPDDWPVWGLVDIIPAYVRSGTDDFFDSIDVLLNPTRANESYGLAVREAVLRGVWPVTSDTPAILEAVTDGVDATVLPEGAGAPELARAISAILDDPSRYRLPVDPDNPRIATVGQQVDELMGHYEDIAR